METRIKEEGILEFRSLVMSAKYLDQLRSEPHYSGDFIGWVNTGAEWYIAQVGSSLIKVSRIDMWDWMVGHLGGAEEGGSERLAAAAEKEGLSSTRFVNWKLDEFRNTLPQIFLK